VRAHEEGGMAPIGTGHGGMGDWRSKWSLSNSLFTVWLVMESLETYTIVGEHHRLGL
jgi:hypothetical protein